MESTNSLCVFDAPVQLSSVIPSTYDQFHRPIVFSMISIQSTVASGNRFYIKVSKRAGPELSQTMALHTRPMNATAMAHTLFPHQPSRTSDRANFFYISVNK